MYEAHGEKLRYLVVGACNTALGYLLFLALLSWLGPVIEDMAASSVAVLSRVGENYYLAVQWVAWLLAVPLGTATLKYFAFRSPGRLPEQIGRSYLVYLPAPGLSSLVLWVAVAVVHLVPQVGQIAAIAAATVFSYLGHKYFTFRHGADAEPRSGCSPPA
jgi:putative flippase GtrA